MFGTEQLLTCEEDNELTPLWKGGRGGPCPLEWTDCSFAIRASARLMMSPMRWMKPSFSDGKMNSLCTLKTKKEHTFLLALDTFIVCLRVHLCIHPFTHSKHTPSYPQLLFIVQNINCTGLVQHPQYSSLLEEVLSFAYSGGFERCCELWAGCGDCLLSAWYNSACLNAALITAGALMMPGAPTEPRPSKQKPTVF